MKHFIISLGLIFFCNVLFAQEVLMQNGTINQSSGTFYDSGGASGNYSDNENYELTICSDVAGESIQLDFSTFSSQGGSNPDVMTIYDGDDTNAPILETVSGGGASAQVGTVTASSSNTSGCLTITFTSNASGTASGWTATISSFLPCQDIVASIDSTTPPAVGGIVEVDPGESINFVGSATFSTDGTGAVYEWDFGDGSPIETGTDVNHSYATFGTYTVTLTVTDLNPLGCSDTATITVEVLDNDSCDGALSICSDLEDIPSAVGGEEAEDGIDYGCLGSQPNPRWYYFKSGGEAGDLHFTLEQTSTGGGNADVDFIVWGPFDDPACGPANLNSGTQVDCSYSSAAVENIDILNAPANSYYTLLITNYGGNAGTFNLSLDEDSTTDTDCGIICEVDLGEDQDLCGETEYTITPTSNGTFSTYEWQLDGVVIAGETEPTLTVSDPGTYTLIADGVDAVFGDPCVAEDSVVISLGNSDASFTMTPICDGATVDQPLATPGGTFTFNPDPGGTVVIDENTGTITGGAPNTTYTVVYTTSGTCPDSSEQSVTVLPQPVFVTVSSNTPICSGEDAVFSISGTASYEVEYTINSGAVTQVTLDGDGLASITVSGATANQTLEVTSVTNPTTTCVNDTTTITETVTVTAYDDPSFTMTATCDGATVNTVTTPEGTYAFNPDPGDEAVLDFDTGTVTGASSGMSYTIEYTTNGDCPASSQETFTVLTTLDSSFTMIPTCDGGTVDQPVAASGGTFAFETAPTDTASVDGITGEVTAATSGASYTITHTVGIDCFSTSTFELIVLSQDDSSFAMTPTCDGGTVTTQPIASGGQYSFDASSPAGNTGAINDSNTGEVTGASPGEQYVISYTSAGTCPTTSTFDLEVYSLPVVVDPTPLEVCDDGTPDGIVEMDLTVKDDEITGANPSYTVTYYEQVDANGDPVPSSEITTPEAYTNTVPNMQTLYVLVTDENTTCSDTTTLQLEVEQAPATTTPDALEYCDPDSDGFGVFTLTDANAQITGGASGLIVTYHETMIDAENNLNALASPYNNIVMNTQTIYVRVESETIATDCASFEELVLIVHPTPAIADPTPLEICDDETTDGFATFDLTTKDTEILNGLDPTLYTVIYYLEEADAEVPQNAIASPNAYTNTTAYNQTVWVRVEDNTTGCYKVTSLELVVNALPVLEQPDPLTLCDYNNPGDEIEEFTLEDANAQILNGQTGITLTYYDTEENAETGDGTGQLFSPYVNGPNPEAIYVRGENDVTGCWSIVILDLRVAPLPSPATPADYEVCDDDNDGFAEFDLESQSDAIENGEPDITITYHETEVDANSGENPLPDNYTNIVVNTQTVYVRAEHTGATPAEATGCFTIVELTLIVLPAPVIPVTLPDYVICDEDTDGYAQFDFDTVMDPQIYGSQDPADFILSYHTTLAAAESGNNPIINTSNYTNGMQWAEDIYIHLESIANGCITTRMFTIRVVTAPEVNPNYDHILTSCDDLDENYQEINDGFTSFNLTSEDLEITDGEASWIVTYYETQADAEAGINAIDPATDYTNIDQGVQTIVAEVTDTDTGCSSFTTVTLQVLPNPSPSPDPENLELCDDNNSGDMMETFDLTENEGYILNNEDGVTLSYYTSQEDAVMGTNAIADATQHSNEDPDNLGTGITPQTIYVRAENTGTPDVPATGCYSLVTFDVIVNPLPVVPDSIEGLLYCEIDNDGTYDDFGFDLESQTEIILNGQDPMIYTVTYHIDQADADAGENALISPYENIQNPQIIYVNVTNTETDCTISTLNFTIEVQEGALANQNLEPYEICDDNMEFDGDTTNDMAEFDLSTQNALALDGQDPNNYTVTYYASQEDADAFTNPLPILYTNAVNPQTIIVRVDNDTPGPIIGLDLSLVDAPGLDFNNDGTMDTYDTDNDNIFDFINVNVDDNDDNVSDGYDYDSDGLIDAIDIDDDNIGDLVYINGEIVNDTSMCYETAELVLQVNPMPSFDLEDSYLLCVNTNGTEVVNVPLIDTGLDVTNYSFEWSLNDVVIPGETGPSITPTQGGKYSVVVTDVNTGCSTNPTDPNTITQVNESQPPTIVAEQTTLAFADQHNISVQVTNITPDNIGIYEFSIDGSEWSSNTPNDAMYLFENVEAGDHIIKARDINGCGETAINITIMDYPHYFTPNGDSYNDTWNIYGLSNQLDAKIYIFDRLGKLIKQISPAGEGWDGTYRGNLMPTNDYWFTVEYREPNATIEDAKKTFKAHFTLKR